MASSICQALNREGEDVFDKPGYGAFRATDLDHCLRTMGVRQGLTLPHFSPQHKHILWDTLGA